MSFGKCEECQIGRCRPETMSWVQEFEGRMVILPNAPATRCDVCGHINFDPVFLVTMKYLLEQFAKDSRTAAAQQKAPPDRYLGWSHVRRGA